MPKVKPVRIMPLGDSTTLGIFRGGEAPGGYRTRLYQRLISGLYTERGVDFVGGYNDNPDPKHLPKPDHHGVSGYRIDQHLPFVEEVVGANQPEVILVHLGTNDVLQNHNLARASDRMEQLLQAIFAVAPNSLVLLAQIIDANRGSSLYGSLTLRIRQYNIDLSALASRLHTRGHPVVLVDLFEAITNPDHYNQTRDDPVHPSEAGYDQMGDAWFEALQAESSHSIRNMRAR